MVEMVCKVSPPSDVVIIRLHDEAMMMWQASENVELDYRPAFARDKPVRAVAKRNIGKTRARAAALEHPDLRCSI